MANNSDDKEKIKFKFPTWKFKSFIEFRIWDRMNLFWAALDEDWKEDRFAEYWKPSWDEEAKGTDDALVFDHETFDFYMRSDEEDFFDDFDENESFATLIRAPVMFPLSDEYYEIYVFFCIILTYFLFNMHLGVLSLFLYLIYAGEFEEDTDDDDDFAENDELFIDSLYRNGFELGEYQWQEIEKFRITKENADFLFFYNVSRFLPKDNNLGISFLRKNK